MHCRHLGGREIGTFPANVPREPAVGVHGFVVDISSYQDAYTHQIYVTAIDTTSGEETFLQGVPKRMQASGGGPCAPPDCALEPSPAVAAAGSRFDMIFSYSYNPGSNGLPIGPRALARVDYPGSPSDTTPERYDFPSSRDDGTHTFDGSDGNPPDGTYQYGLPGTYGMYASMRYTNNALDQTYVDTCSDDVVIATQPFFKVWSNDIQVGGSFPATDGTCTTREEYATVIGYGGDYSTNVFTGASTEYGLSALGEVRNFFSAAQRSPRNSTPSTWPIPPHGLTIANAQIEANGFPQGARDPADNDKVANYGGFSEITSCAQDWLATMPDGLTPISSSTIDPNSVNGAVHNRQSGTITIHGGSMNSSGSIFLPEADDVVITGDITAADGASLYIITNGNIKVSSRVRRIDAVLITTKTLYTCTNSNGAQWNTNQLYDRCGGLAADGLSGKLIIRGAVVADQIKLQRTYGTRALSQQNESASLNGGNNAAAEEIIFDPSLYVVDPALRQPPREKKQIDFMTSLPPIL